MERSRSKEEITALESGPLREHASQGGSRGGIQSSGLQLNLVRDIFPEPGEQRQMRVKLNKCHQTMHNKGALAPSPIMSVFLVR